MCRSSRVATGPSTAAIASAHVRLSVVVVVVVAVAVAVAATGRARRITVDPGPGDSADEGPIEVEGVVTDTLANAMFKIELADGHEVLAHLSGSIRRHAVKVLPGDRIRLELSPFDPSRGRITYRFK